MTGELCDCFRTKADGVRHILEAVQQGAKGRDVRVYCHDGSFVAIDEARQAPHRAAASNWHALAKFSCRFVEGASGLLMDIGSTTTDLVPLITGKPGPAAFKDTDRLLAGELVYTGVGRTPVCAIMRALPWRGRQCPVAAELFASAADAYVILGDFEEQLSATWTADGRPLTKKFSRERLARMICADDSIFTMADAEAAAAAIREAQVARLEAAVWKVTSTMRESPKPIVLSGSGEFLARQVVRRCMPGAKLVSLSERLGKAASDAAPAYALAVLANDADRSPF
jgi:probable H4MPT-linked C1 transfer pathway protein